MSTGEPAGQILIKVAVDYADGTSEVIRATGPVQNSPAALLIPTERNGHVGIPLAAVKRWEATTSGLMLVPGAN